MICNNEGLGQLIITGISGTDLTIEEEKFISDNQIGGVILFAYNYENPIQLAGLCQKIQSLSKSAPLFISVDQEGGRVRRFKTHFIQLPSMLELGRLGSPKLVYEAHHIMATELSACGINLNFSPVCDIWTNPSNKVIGDRAFGTDPETVSKFVSAAIRGLQSGNVCSCAKHFPGHGDTSLDSHYDLPVVKKDLEVLRGMEMIPFVKAAKSKVDFFMMAHLIVEFIDKGYPTSLCEKAYDLLRSETRFQGLIITDDLEMKAITDRHTVENASQLALKAGANILLYRSVTAAQQGLEGVRKNSREDHFMGKRIQENISQILDFKRRKILPYRPISVSETTQIVGCEKHQLFLKDLKSTPS